MKERLEQMKCRVRDREHKSLRQDVKLDICEECEAEELSWPRRMARITEKMCEAERPVILPDEQIVFTRTVKGVPGAPMPKDVQARLDAEGKRTGWGAGNICCDWGMPLSQGLLGRREVAERTRHRLANDADAVEFLDAAIQTIDAVLGLVARYAEEARKQGRDDLVAILEQVPARPPRTFHQALQSHRFMHAAVWMSGSVHVGLGRLDQYMWPYLKADLDAGRLTTEQAEELLAEFFIGLNKDTDLYPGVQQGDNGQSLMLGGVTREGNDAVNPLTWMVLRVSHDVNMIDPKINLRVNRNTDIDLLTEAARLTRRGLGFPQYANDEVVIPGLAAHGYDLEDARDYTVAACWEFIIPGRGMDAPGAGAMSFPAATDKAIREGLAAGDTFEQILERTRLNIRQQVQAHVNRWKRSTVGVPAPYYSVLMTDCLEQGRDVTDGGAKYYNHGIHGAGSSNAVDALAAVKKFVFTEQSVAPDELLRALAANFENDEPLRQKLFNEGPKLGNDDSVNSLLTVLFDLFAEACEEIQDNGRGGIVRAGTGTAMYYIWLAKKPEEGDMAEPGVGATADGRHAGDFFSSSLAPSPGVKVRGPISILQAFSNIDYQRVCNGGPITMELSDTVFRDEEAVRKVAMLVRTFAMLGCQQLQLNTLNVKVLQDAKQHPERHRDLIVRVWGWSGYFCELDEPYQDHIIARHSFAL